MNKVLFVGETNPYGANPQFALYHLPRQASGNRLREHLGLSDEVYERIPKVQPPRGVQFGTLRCHAFLRRSDGKEALETLTMKEAIERMDKLASWGGLEATCPYLDAIRNEFFGLTIFVGGRA